MFKDVSEAPGTQKGRLKALRLSGLGPPWTGRAESILDQTVFIQHGLGKVSSSSHRQVLPAHACTNDPYSPSKPGSVKIIHLGPRASGFLLFHPSRLSECTNLFVHIWRHEDASVPLETFVAGLTSLLPQFANAGVLRLAWHLYARRNRCSGMQSIFKALHQEQSWWKVRTFLLLGQDLQSPSSGDSLLSSLRASGSSQTKRSVRWFDPLFLLS